MASTRRRPIRMPLPTHPSKPDLRRVANRVLQILSSQLTLAVPFVFLAGPSHAMLTEIDDASLPASLDGFNLTYDDTTELEWLDLTITAGRTFDDIVGNDGTDELGPGGDFEGFRHATDLEVSGWTTGPQLESLFASFGLTGTFASIGGHPLTSNFMSYVGCFAPCSGYGFVQGIAVDDADPQLLRWFMAQTFFSQGSDFGSLYYSNSGPLTSNAQHGSLQTAGHFLVRGVPEPGVVTGLAPTMMLLAWLSRRRAH